MKVLLLPALLIAYLLAITSCQLAPIAPDGEVKPTPDVDPVALPGTTETIGTPKVFTSVLWLGDSQSVGDHGLGETLFKASPLAQVPFSWVARCSARPSQLKTGYKSSCGSKTIPASLGAAPKVEEMVKAKAYDLVIVQAAGNLLGYNNSFVTKDVSSLLSVIPDSIPCVWVGLTERVGTNSFDESKLNDLLKAAVQPRCTYVDLLPLGAYPRSASGKALRGDGTHLNSSYGEAFKFLMNKYAVAFNQALSNL